MMHEGDRRGYQPPVIDIPSMISRITSGEELATVELDQYLRPKLMRFFSRKLPQEAEDLTQDTLLEISAALPRFDPTPRGKGDVSRNFDNWTYAIARTSLNIELRRMLGKPETSFSETTARVNLGSGFRDAVMLGDFINDQGLEDKNWFNQPDETKSLEPEEMLPRFRERLAELLSPSQLQIAEMSLAGRTRPEIMAELEISERAALNRLSRAREKVEGELFYPAGLRQVADYEDMALNQAAHRGSLSAVKFLGRWYTTDEWVRRHQLTRVAVVPGAVNENFLLLAENTTKDEYGTLLGVRYSSLLVRHQGRVYVSAEELAEFRKRRRRAIKRLKSPAEGFAPLASFEVSLVEQQRLYSAAMRGEITAIKEGSYWFVKPEEVGNFLSNQPPAQRPAPRSIEARVIRDIIVYDSSEIPEIPEDDSPEAFNEWFFAIGRIVTEQRLPWRKRRKLAHPSDMNQALALVSSQFEEWLRRRGVNFYPSFHRIALSALQGKRRGEIAEEIGWTPHSVGATLSHVRKAVEEGLLYPAGIRRLADYRDNAISIAAVMGRTDAAVWFMGKWYTTDQKVSEYKQGRNV